MKALRHPEMEAQGQLAPRHHFVLHAAAQLLTVLAKISPDTRSATAGPQLELKNNRCNRAPKRGTTLALLKLVKMTRCPASILVSVAAISHREHHSGAQSLGTLGPNSSLQWPRECAALAGQGVCQPHTLLIRPWTTLEPQCTTHITYF